VASPAASDAAVNVANPVTSAFLRPYTSASLPPASMRPAKVMM
jgi:hypothetical protein